MTQRLLFRRLWTYIRPFRWELTGIWLLVMLSIPLHLLSPLPLSIAVDSLIGSQPLPGWLQMLAPDALTGTPTALLVLILRATC